MAWSTQPFIEEEFASQCEGIQERPFLRTTARPPAVGHRVELKFVGEKASPYKPFRLSGEVVAVGETPKLKSWRPLINKEDARAETGRVGSNVLLHILSLNCDPTSKVSTALKDAGPVPNFRRYAPRRGGVAGLEYIENMWSRLPKKEKLRAYQYALKWLGAIQGQEVTCEARLDFDTDGNRGNDVGPWKDGVPFDGRDIYRFVLRFDDFMMNKWCLADPASVVNLGPGTRARCWPWSDDEVLPYMRRGVDRVFPKEMDPIAHACLGPFGCSGEDHGHDKYVEHEEVGKIPLSLIPSINKKDNVKRAVGWMVEGDIVGVDTKGFAKHFPRTAQDLMDGTVTPEQVANDLESITIMGRLLQSVTFSALHSSGFKGQEEKRAPLRMKFKRSLRLGLMARVRQSWASDPNECDNFSLLLKESVDEACEAHASEIDEALYDGQRGCFIQLSILYGASPEYYDEEQGHMPCQCCRENYYRMWSSTTDEQAGEISRYLLMALRNVALGLHKAKNMCWQCHALSEDAYSSCSGCSMATYCSRACQRAAWKEGHKDKCDDLGEMWRREVESNKFLCSVAPSPRSKRMAKEMKAFKRIEFMNKYHKTTNVQEVASAYSMEGLAKVMERSL